MFTTIETVRTRSCALLVVAFAALGIGVGPGCSDDDDQANAGLNARTESSKLDGLVKVERVVYTTFDGSRVPAVMAIPRAAKPRGCLVWENGLGSRKEDVAPIWPGAAALGLATFSIDLRSHGERAKDSSALERAVREPSDLEALVRGTVADLSRALDYLDSRPECRHNLGYAGVSLGGMIGTVLAGRDQRIRATVIMSTPPTWHSLIRATDIILPGIERDPARLDTALGLLSPLDPERWIGRIAPRPAMLLIGRHDPLVPPKAAREIEAAAGEPKVVVNYDGGHIPLAGKASDDDARRIGAFLLRYLVAPTFD